MMKEVDIRTQLDIWDSQHQSREEKKMHHQAHSNSNDNLSVYHQQARAKAAYPNREEGSRKHLLGLLSSFTRQQEEVRSEQVEQLCCYDRMKKLICRSDGDTTVQQQKDLISAIVIQQKINQLEARLHPVKTATPPAPPSPLRPTSNHFLRRSCLIEDVKKHCLQKYLSHKKGLKERGDEDVKKWVEKEVERRVEDLIQERKNEFTRLQAERTRLEQELLAKQLEIESLRSKEGWMREYISQLEEKCKGKQNRKTATPNARNSCQLFVEQFNESFNGMTIQQVKHRLQFSVDKCLEQFDRVQNRNQQRMKEQAKLADVKQHQMIDKVRKLEDRENQLINNLKNLKLNRQISQIEINELCKAKARLENLQKLILSLYNDWHAERSQSEKKMMKCLGNLTENYSYEDMLKYIVDYGKKYCTNQKLNDFLFKVLRGVQKIKRVLWPDQCNEKLDALATMQKIEKWIKIKAGQNSRLIPKKKTQGVDENYSYFNQGA